MILLGKKAIVTGASRGIGRGCALELARAGADLVVNDRLADAESESLLAQVRGLGREVHFLPANVFEREGCASVVDQAIRHMGRIDILVSNPACSRRADFLTFPPDTFQEVLQGTLVGGFHMSQLVARHMVERGGGGKILFICTIHTRIPYARSAAYNAAKSGLKNLAFTIAAELLPHRINVNVIDPGWIDTPAEHASFGSDTLARIGPTLPWSRLGTPADIGKAAVFLASDAADYITGTDLLVDGGMRLGNAREAAEDQPVQPTPD
ncbi:MAG: SDR family NAD(P)-dependent oxidoreductase [Gemmataceae bacterium]